MDLCIINRKSVKKNKSIRKAQKISKKYFKYSTYQNKKNEPKTKIEKYVDIQNIEMVSLTNKNCDNQVVGSANKDEFANDISKIQKEELIAKCKECNLTGQSGNRFPTATKLENFQNDGGVLLINGIECDPSLIHDAWIYRNKLDDIEQGAKILNNVFHFDRMILATKEPASNSKDFIFEQCHMKNLFPLGYENYLIKSILNIEVPENKIPSEMGVLVLNIQTVMKIGKIFQDMDEGQKKYITVANLLDGTAKAVEVTNGQNAKDILKEIFPSICDESEFYIGGGSNSCQKMNSQDVVDSKTSFIAIANLPDYENAHNCKGCGKCSRVCLAGVQVAKIIKYVEKNGRTNVAECKAFNPEKCIGCGACTFYCNAGKDTREVVAWAKNQ